MRTPEDITEMYMKDCNMPHDIEIEDQNTWPKEILSIMHENKDLFIQFHQEQHDIFVKQQQRTTLLMIPAKSEYKEEYSGIVSKLANILSEHNIVGYHCTRLTPSEIETIKNAGLRKLTWDLVNTRLESALNEEIITQEQHDYIISCDELRRSLGNEKGCRTGHIWFCPNRSTMKDGGGVSSLFQSWGGEAVYNGHENAGDIGSTLKSIGTPCIVKCSIPIADISENTQFLSERFVSQFMSGDLEFLPEPPAGFDMRINRDLVPSEVLEIIKFNDPEFEEFTNHTNWNEDELLS